MSFRAAVLDLINASRARDFIDLGVCGWSWHNFKETGAVPGVLGGPPWLSCRAGGRGEDRLVVEQRADPPLQFVKTCRPAETG
ncbi:MAG: hypothetical protein ABW022_20170 [Actinoplanes sp.]